MWHSVVIPLILLAFQIRPGSAKNLLSTFGLLQRSGNIESFVGRAAWVIADSHTHPVEYDPNLNAKTFRKRDDKPAAAATFNETAFNQTVTQACTHAINNYANVVNPAGVVVCYNIAFFDNTTGVFQTDVRLYQRNDPSGDFTGANPSNYMLGMSIPEATLSAPVSILQSSVSNVTSPANGQLLQGFQNVGQMNSALTLSELTVSDLRVLMIPTITLAVQNTTTHQVANTTLSSDTLSYVAGELVQSGGTPTNITVPVAAAEASPIVTSVSKFVLPGTHIQIFPIGLIITCAWSGILGLAVGLGTIGRYRFRQNYRARVRRGVSGKS